MKWLKHLVIIVVATLVGVFASHPLFVFLTTKVLGDLWYDLPVYLFTFLGIGLAVYAVAIWRHANKLLLCLAAFFWLWGCSLGRLAVQYEGVHDIGGNHILAQRHNRLGVLNHWGSPITAFRFTGYLECLTDWDSFDSHEEYACILEDDGDYYVLCQNSQLLEASQLRFADAEYDSGKSHSDEPDSLSGEGVYAYMVGTGGEGGNCYTFFNSAGVHVCTTQDFVISISDWISDPVIEAREGSEWVYYDITSLAVEELQRSDTHSNEDIVLSNFRNANTDGVLVFASSLKKSYTGSPSRKRGKRQVPSHSTDEGKSDNGEKVSSPEQGMAVCPICNGNGKSYGTTCGFCNGTGEVSAVAAMQLRHVISGGSISDFYPSSGGASDGNQGSSGPRDMMCPACDGKGTCPVCHGIGKVSNYGYTSVCNYCYGEGKCPKCMGRGLIPEHP